MLSYAFLKGLPDATCEALRRLGQTRSFPPGAALFSQGDAPIEIFGIAAGRAKLWRVSESGASLVLTYLHQGALVGITAAAGSLPHLATATAITPVVATVWSAARISELAAGDASLGARISTRLARHTELLVARLEELTAAGVEERVARMLLRLACETGQAGDGSPVNIRLAQAEVAELAQSTVPTVSRLLGRWRAAGIVASGRGSLAILDLYALAAIARVHR